MSASIPDYCQRNPDTDIIQSIKEIHSVVPLAGSPPNALLSADDELLYYLICIIQNKPSSPPDRTAEEWDNLLTLLRPHGIYPLLARHLKGWDPEYHPPAEVMEFLSQVLISGCVQSIRNGIQVQKITSALEEAGIPNILLKGHALGRTVYGDPALRHSSDIDILVKPDDVPLCEPVFEELGYSSPVKDFQISRHSEHHQHFYPPKKALTVELHWTIDHNYNLFSPGWFDESFVNRIKITSEDLSCHTLDPVSHLTFLVYHHVFQHQSLRLDWICDIAFMMNSLNIEEWEKLRSTCVLNHIRIPLEIALTAASLWSGYNLPEEYSDFSKWEPASVREQELWALAKTRRGTIHSGFFLTMQGMPNTWKKFQCCYRFVFPHKDHLKKYRRSDSRFDIPLAHIRRWLLGRNYKL